MCTANPECQLKNKPSEKETDLPQAAQQGALLDSIQQIFLPLLADRLFELPDQPPRPRMILAAVCF